ncbi:MAG: hypothetical protein M5F18_10640 [Asgard group archaeon]|nr:hypothetical protein [Asgard group archaeon]
MTQQKSFSQPKKNKTRQNLSVARRRPTTGEKKKRKILETTVLHQSTVSKQYRETKEKEKKKKNFLLLLLQVHLFQTKKKKLRKISTFHFKGPSFLKSKGTILVKERQV